ncbi:unnamed protein product [Schistosoma turkestanicum]|nr:unnamed protein product [Schistosoma turkestanicum]
MYHFSKTTELTNLSNSNWTIVEHLIQTYAAENLSKHPLNSMFNVKHHRNQHHHQQQQYSHENAENLKNYNEHQALALHINYGRSEFGTHRILWVKLILAIIYGLLAFMGITSNLIVTYILIFMRRRALTSITNIFVLVLAISDILLCSFNMPLQAYYDLKETIILKNEILCKFIFACFCLPMHISCLTILLIACDRYQIIIYPLRPRMSVKLALILIGITIIISIINAIPIALFNIVSNAIHTPIGELQIIIERQPYMYQFVPGNMHSYCVENWPNPESRLLYSIIVFFIHFFIPLILTAGLYGHIYCRLHERRFRKGSVERKRRTNKILIRIVICFTLCWTPWNCFSLWLEIHAYELQKNSLTLSNFYQTTIQEEYKLAQLNNYSLLNKYNHTSVIDTLDVIGEINNTSSSSSSSPLHHHRNHELQQQITQINQTDRNSQNYYLHPMGGNIKLIDLSLKLLAMTSACINPWLYGWFKKFVFGMTKKLMRKLKRLKCNKDDLLNIVQYFHEKYNICFTKRLPWLYMNKKLHNNTNTNIKDSNQKIINDLQKIKNKSQDYATNPLGGTADYQEEGEEAGEDDNDDEMRKNSKLNIYICYSCGFVCTCQLSLKSFKRKDHYQYIKRYHDNESYYSTEPLTKPLNECSERRIIVGEAMITDLMKQTKNNSAKCSTSNSSRQYGSKSSNGQLGAGGGNNLINSINHHNDNKPTDTTNSSTNKYGKFSKENLPSKSMYSKFNRKTSSHISGISFGTMSYLDPSTKQTSLFPSSGILPTPRSSFLNTGSQISHNNENQNQDIENTEQHTHLHNSPHQQQPQQTQQSHEIPMNELISNQLKPLLSDSVDSIKQENEISNEYDNVLSINVPMLQPKKSINHLELDQLNEQSNESSSIPLQTMLPVQGHLNCDMSHTHILPELIRVNVHSPLIESTDHDHINNNSNNNDIDHKNSSLNDDIRYEDKICRKLEFNDKTILSRNRLEINLSDSYAATIPFVDEENSFSEGNVSCQIVNNRKCSLNNNKNNKNNNNNNNEHITINQSQDRMNMKKSVNQINTLNSLLPSSIQTTSALTSQPKSQPINKLDHHIIKEKKPRKLSIYMKNSTRRISNGMNLFITRKQKHLEKHEIIPKTIVSERRLSFPNVIDRKKLNEDKKISFKKKSSDLFTSATSDETSDLDDFVHISRMVAMEVIRKRKICERAQSVCVALTSENNRTNNNEKTTNTIKQEHISSFNKRKSFTGFHRGFSLSSSIHSSNKRRFTQNYLTTDK